MIGFYEYASFPVTIPAAGADMLLKINYFYIFSFHVMIYMLINTDKTLTKLAYTKTYKTRSSDD